MNGKNLTGKVFGRLVVVELAEPSPAGLRQWLCQCECGNFTTVLAKNLTRTKESTRSCGCLRSEKAANRMMKYNKKLWTYHKKKLNKPTDGVVWPASHI